LRVRSGRRPPGNTGTPRGAGARLLCQCAECREPAGCERGASGLLAGWFSVLLSGFIGFRAGGNPMRQRARSCRRSLSVAGTVAPSATSVTQAPAAQAPLAASSAAAAATALTVPGPHSLMAGQARAAPEPCAGESLAQVVRAHPTAGTRSGENPAASMMLGRPHASRKVSRVHVGEAPPGVGNLEAEASSSSMNPSSVICGGLAGGPAPLPRGLPPASTTGARS
jgi:hypothetical protein